MMLKITIDLSHIPENPEKDLEGNSIQEQYLFRSHKDPKIIQRIIEELEDNK